MQAGKSLAPTPTNPQLAPSQIANLAEYGTEQTAPAGTTIYCIGQSLLSFIVILEGEVAVVDGAGVEIVRHGQNGFLGELNLLNGQTSMVSAIALTPLRYLAVPRDTFRTLLFDDAPLSDVFLSTIIARRELLERVSGLGVEIFGPRSSQLTVELVQYTRSNRVPAVWRDTDDPNDPEAAATIAELEPVSLPLVRLPGGAELHAPSTGQLSRALGIGAELAELEEVDLAVLGAGPAGLGAAVYGASEGLSTLVLDCRSLGGQAGFSRRIENYLGFPAGITGSELTSRAATQARKFGARMASPYRVVGLEPGDHRHVVHLEEGREVHAKAVLLATGAEYRRLPLENLADFEGTSIFYAAGPPEGKLCGGERVGVVGGGNSAGQAAVWLSRGGALVTLLHRRADLAETMSNYLLRELDRYGVEVRDRSEVGALHGAEGHLSGVTLKSGEDLPIKYLFLFLGASPCTDWLGNSVGRDDNGFILTGAQANCATLLGTTVPGIFAAGDARSGSGKRVATAVGEGAMAVQLIHSYLAE